MTAYNPFQKKQRMNVVKDTTLNTLSRIWQVMVAATGELKMAGNPKQNFDMLIIRMINISDLPAVSEILAGNKVDVKPQTKNAAPGLSNIDSATTLSSFLSNDKELVLLTEWNNNTEINEFGDGKIKFHYAGIDRTFTQKLSIYLKNKTGKLWTLEITESKNMPTVNEIKTEELKSDPLVSDALSLFEDATVISIK